MKGEWKEELNNGGTKRNKGNKGNKEINGQKKKSNKVLHTSLKPNFTY